MYMLYFVYFSHCLDFSNEDPYFFTLISRARGANPQAESWLAEVIGDQPGSAAGGPRGPEAPVTEKFLDNQVKDLPPTNLANAEVNLMIAHVMPLLRNASQQFSQRSSS